MLGTKSGSDGGHFSNSMAELAPTLHQTTEAGEYYLPTEQVQLLEKLEHLSRYSHYIQIVLGVSGSGKSTLLKQLLPGSQDADVQACVLRGEVSTDLSDLLDGLVEQLAIDLPVSASDEDKLQAIYEHADLLEEISRVFLIIVDDADKLNDECLDLLVNLLQSVRNPDSRPHLLMFAAPLLADRMNATARFKEVLDSSCHFTELKPFEIDETREFLSHRYGPVADDLSDRQLARIQQDSFGLPGRMPKAMDKILAGSGGDEGRASAGSRRGISLARIGVVSVLLLLLGGYFLLPESSVDGGGERVRVELPVPAETKTVSEPEVAAIAEPASALEARLKEAESRLLAESKASLETAVVEDRPESGEAPAAAAEIAAVVEEKKTDSADADIAQHNQLAVAPVKPAEPEAGVVVEAEVAAPEQPKKLVLRIPAAESVATAATAPNKLKLSTVSPKPSSPYLREELLLSWKPSGYTLQMLGARKESSVTRFIRGQAGPENFYYFSTIYKEKPWHVVVYGNYSSRQKAIAAVKSLPPALRKRKPWARSVQGVQDDIRRKK